MVEFDARANTTMNNVLSTVRMSWSNREPKSSEIDGFVKNYMQTLKNFVNHREMNKLAKDYVRTFFKVYHGQEDFKVSLWQRINDINPFKHR